MMEQGNEDIDNCPICLEAIVSSAKGKCLLKTPCNHTFHRPCLLEWFKSGSPGNCCPLCKRLMKEDDAIPVTFKHYKVPLRRSDRISTRTLNSPSSSSTSPPAPSSAAAMQDANAVRIALRETFQNSEARLDEWRLEFRQRLSEEQLADPVYQRFFEQFEQLAALFGSGT